LSVQHLNSLTKIGLPLKNWHLPGHKYTGPFTDLESRIDKNNNPLPGYELYNQIDNIALHHDVGYKTADEFGNKTRHQCDKEMLNELNEVKARKFKCRRVYVSNFNKIWSADLMDKSSLSKQNKGYKYLLNVIDLFSKYAYSIPLTSKSQHEVAAALAKLFFLNKPDQGSEFINKSFKKFLNEHNIELYHILYTMRVRLV